MKLRDSPQANLKLLETLIEGILDATIKILISAPFHMLNSIFEMWLSPLSFLIILSYQDLSTCLLPICMCISFIAELYILYSNTLQPSILSHN